MRIISNFKRLWRKLIHHPSAADLIHQLHVEHGGPNEKLRAMWARYKAIKCSKNALLLIIVVTSILTGCSAQTPEEKWLTAQVMRCNAMASCGAYDNETHTFECFRTPFGRMPKLMFSAVYHPVEDSSSTSTKTP